VCGGIARNVAATMPGSIRLHVPVSLGPAAEVDLAPGQAHYLGVVMRRAAGDTVLLFNGSDGEWLARIMALRRDRARLVVEARTRGQAAEPDLWLAFALLKREATELVVQKATELGAAALLPVITSRTNAPRLRPERLAAIATEAAEQCERLTVPRIDAPQSLANLLAGWPAGRPLVVATERQDAPPPRAALPAALLVGPEGGFAPDELDVLTAQPFVTAASLGPRILRAETASIVGLALLLASGGG
jgi:16S rRNA (uracil1498-N3)-methyltransferase